MKRILDKNQLIQYFYKYNIKDIFDTEMINYAELHFYQKDEIVLKSEDQLQYYYLLVDGKIKIFNLYENGKTMLLKVYKDFITIGDIELLKNKPIRCNVEASEDTYFIAIPASILRTEYMDDPKFLHHLIDSLSEKLEATINNSSYNYVYPLINRLASYLVEHITDKNFINLNSSFKEIAEFLGTTTRHLNRTFKDLEARSVITLENKTVIILNEEMLRELSKTLYIKSL